MTPVLALVTSPQVQCRCVVLGSYVNAFGAIQVLQNHLQEKRRKSPSDILKVGHKRHGLCGLYICILLHLFCAKIVILVRINKYCLHTGEETKHDFMHLTAVVLSELL